MINKKILTSFAAVSGLVLSMTACDVISGKETVPSYGHSVSVTTQIENELLMDPNTKFLGVHVETVAGGVQLSGTVNSQEQKNHIGNIAQRVANQYRGSERVHVRNDLMVMNKPMMHR